MKDRESGFRNILRNIHSASAIGREKTKHEYGKAIAGTNKITARDEEN